VADQSLRQQRKVISMKLTKALKSWLVENCDVKEDADDGEFRKAAGMAMAEGKLAAEKYMELTKEEGEDKADGFTKKFNAMASQIESLARAVGTIGGQKEKTLGEKTLEEKIPAPKKKVPSMSQLAKMISDLGGVEAEADGKGIDVRVKEAVEQYSDTKTAMIYPTRTLKGRHSLAGNPVDLYGRGLNTPSDRDRALAGTFAKFQLLSVTPKFAGSPRRAWEVLSEHEKSLLATLADDCMWDDSEYRKDRQRKGYPGGIKALIDDSTSGGTEAAPIVFDDMVIEAPLLYGELFPLVNQIPLERGRRIEGVAIGTVTGSWGGVDDTAIGLFTTTAYVTAFDTTIYRWQGSIKIGLDFIADSPIDFGTTITKQYGERLLEDLDDAIADGNGTTQPEGVLNKSGATSVTFSSTTSISNYESLRFSVAKPEHNGAMGATAVFCGNETSYQRAMAIPVGTSDARRLFDTGGTTSSGRYDEYRFMNRKYAINESLGNTELFYAILGRYRMYRRKGLAVRTSTEGDTLIRANEMLIVVQARYGGQMERAACVAITSDAPS